MSAVARWSYTAKATHWPATGRDAWSGRPTFGPAVSFTCDYKIESRRATDAQGVEFLARQTLYTERATIAQGDRVMIGTSTAADPIAAGAEEVKAIVRNADTFERKADDYQVMT